MLLVIGIVIGIINRLLLLFYACMMCLGLPICMQTHTNAKATFCQIIKNFEQYHKPNCRIGRNTKGTKILSMKTITITEVTTTAAITIVSWVLFRLLFLPLRKHARIMGSMTVVQLSSHEPILSSANTYNRHGIIENWKWCIRADVGGGGENRYDRGDVTLRRPSNTRSCPLAISKSNKWSFNSKGDWKMNPFSPCRTSSGNVGKEIAHTGNPDCMGFVWEIRGVRGCITGSLSHLNRTCPPLSSVNQVPR